jgi:hypothetical protein
MSGVMVEIGRLDIALHGVSADIAEAAVSGLESALRRRLDALHLYRTRDVPALRIDALDLPPQTDAAALRDLLAERLIEALGDARTDSGEEEA